MQQGCSGERQLGSTLEAAPTVHTTPCKKKSAPHSYSYSYSECSYSSYSYPYSECSYSYSYSV